MDGAGLKCFESVVVYREQLKVSEHANEPGPSLFSSLAGEWRRAGGRVGLESGEPVRRTSTGNPRVGKGLGRSLNP